jgi:hypothetical protein
MSFTQEGVRMDLNVTKVYRLRAQPRGSDGVYQGVSFFVLFTDPLSSHPPHASPIPSGLFVPLEVPVTMDDETVMVTCGQLWVLNATDPVSASASASALEEVLSSRIQPCEPPDGPLSFVGPYAVDREYMPGNKLTYVAVMALDALAVSSPDADIRFFADRFSLHLRATDMEFSNVLSFGAMTHVIAEALSAWTARDPYLAISGYKAHALLKDVLDDSDATCRPPSYDPYWASS